MIAGFLSLQRGNRNKGNTMRLGFIGTGAITEAIVIGVLRSNLPITEIHVTPRSAAIAEKLAKASPLVRVAAGNQDVVDASDMVFLAIRPQIAEEVVRALHFRAEQHVVSLVAAIKRDTLFDWVGVPARLTQAVPLPFVADHQGVTAIYPPDADVAAFFAALGSAVEARTQAEYELLGVASALMGTFFGIQEIGTRWLEQQGMPYAQAKSYLAPLFESLAKTSARPDSPDFEMLRQEFSTKGGLNEQVFVDFDRHGGGKALHDALTGVLARIQGR